MFLPVLFPTDRCLHVDSMVEAMSVAHSDTPYINFDCLAKILHRSLHARVYCRNSRFPMAHSHRKLHWIGVVVALDADSAALLDQIFLNPEPWSIKIASVCRWQ